MIKFAIAFVVIFQVLFAYGSKEHRITSDSLTFVQIGNIKYDEGRLYLTFQISSYPQHEVIRKEYELPQKDAVNFLKLVDELELTNIRSNDIRCIDCRPFRIEYARGGDKHQVTAYHRGMSEEELTRWDAFGKRIDSTLNMDHWQKVFYADLPDGRYSGAGGMITKHYIKEEGEWFDLSQHPLYMLDGVEVSPLKVRRLQLENYQMEILKDAAATAIYGARGANGVALLTRKR